MYLKNAVWTSETVNVCLLSTSCPLTSMYVCIQTHTYTHPYI